MGRQKESRGYQGPMGQGEIGPWGGSPGSYIAGSAQLDEVDKVAIQVERKWGAGRVRLLVDAGLREKFDRQRYLLNQAVWHRDLEAISRESRRMIAAWNALDKAAAASGAEFMRPEVWECALSDGTVLALARTNDELQAYRAASEAEDEFAVKPAAGGAGADGRKVVLWSFEEVARLIEAQVFEQQAKLAFPGAVVEVVRTSITDPLQSIPDSGDNLDEVPF